MPTRSTIGGAGWRAWVKGRAAHLPWARGVPWAVSMGLHGALLLVGLLLVWRVASHEVLPPEPDPRNAFLDFDDPSPVHGQENARGTARAAGAAPTRVAPDPATAPTREAGATPAPTEAPLVLRGMTSGDAASGGAGPAPPPAALPPPVVRGSSLEPDAGDRAEAPAPMPTSGVTFGGLGATPVRSVVYVVDGSGPMVTSLPGVVEELKRSVSHLSSSQTFGVVIFRDGAGAPGAGAGQPYDEFMPVLVRATPGAKERLSRWLAGVQAGGRSNPLDGLRHAVSLAPDAIFVLSRSIERSGGGVWQMEKVPLMTELDRLNPVDTRNGLRRIVIKTIQFLDEDPTGIMQEVGRVHGSGGAGKGDAGYRVVRQGQELAK